MIVYKITNPFNGKIYIGITQKGLSHRKMTHKNRINSKRGINIPLYNAFKKYGFDNFIFEEIACCKTLEDLNLVEIHLINFYNSTNPEVGYNLASGGLVNLPTEKSKRLSSERIKNLWNNKEFKEKMKQVSIENGKRLSISRKGSNLWSTLTEEQKKQAKETRKNNHVKENHHWYGKGSQLGRKFSEEHKRKISESAKGNTRAGIGSNHFAAKKVMCVETGEIFGSVSEAKLKYPKGNIHKAAREKRTSLGRHWVYLN